MRTWILAAVGGGLLFFTALAVLFFFGYWIPNDPSPTQYPVRGIDVSAHQGRIDWKRVAAGGIRFVYLKATGRLFSSEPPGCSGSGSGLRRLSFL
jgi:hypothetical protein